MGEIIGGLLAMAGLSFILEWAIFKRIVDSPVVGKVGSLAAAFPLAVVLYSFGEPGRGSAAFIIYGIPTLLLLPYKIWRGKQTEARNEEESEEELSRTFE